MSALTYADEPGDGSCFRDEPIWRDGTPDARVQMNV